MSDVLPLLLLLTVTFLVGVTVGVLILRRIDDRIISRMRKEIERLSQELNRYRESSSNGRNGR